MFRSHHVEQVEQVEQVAEVGDVQTINHRFPISSLVGAIIGAAMVVVGIVALLRGDVTGSWREPVVDVVGLDHTPILGLGEIVVGALILIAALVRSRPLMLFFAAALMIFGVVVVLQHESLVDELAVQRAHGWWSFAIGVLLLLVTLLASDDIVQRRRVTTVDSVGNRVA
jgi:hypothetical protein